MVMQQLFSDNLVKSTVRQFLRFTRRSVLLVGMLHCFAVHGVSQSFDLVIANGRVMDPESGLDAHLHIGITGGTIQVISETPLVGQSTIDATGHVVAPGFIDLNTYQHSDPFFRLRAADGVTSVLNLESGAVNVPAYYEALEGRALIHYGTAVDHQTMRRIAQNDSLLEVVNGVTDWPGINQTRSAPELDKRALTSSELDTLATLIEQGLTEGAVAVGFGIAYSPGATHTEILRMFQIATKMDASAHLHVRDFHTTRQWGDLYEVLAGAIYTGGDMHVNHLQSVYGSYTEEALAFIDRARSAGLSITTECYPYTASLTGIDSAGFDDWENWDDTRFHRYEWPETGERLSRDLFAKYRKRGGVVIIHPRNEASQEAAVRTCLAHPLPFVASDGAWDNGQTHPRSAGTNSRVLGRYVKDEGVLSLMAALRKMSLAPAQHLERRIPEMANKGRIRPGADADIVVFDADAVQDRATYHEPLLPPKGINYVLVNGIPVVEEGELVNDVFPGEAIRAPRH